MRQTLGYRIPKMTGRWPVSRFAGATDYTQKVKEQKVTRGQLIRSRLKNDMSLKGRIWYTCA